MRGFRLGVLRSDSSFSSFGFFCSGRFSLPGSKLEIIRGDTTLPLLSPLLLEGVVSPAASAVLLTFMDPSRKAGLLLPRPTSYRCLIVFGRTR